MIRLDNTKSQSSNGQNVVRIIEIVILLVKIFIVNESTQIVREREPEFSELELELKALLE